MNVPRRTVLLLVATLMAVMLVTVASPALGSIGSEKRECRTALLAAGFTPKEAAALTKPQGPGGLPPCPV